MGSKSYTWKNRNITPKDYEEYIKQCRKNLKVNICNLMKVFRKKYLM